MGQKYTEEYKADVLKLADEIGVGAACQQLGISTKTVYNWRRAERLARGEIRGVQPGETPEQAITRLTRELQELHEANYILRKALGFMAGRYPVSVRVSYMHGSKPIIRTVVLHCAVRFSVYAGKGIMVGNADQCIQIMMRKRYRP